MGKFLKIILAFAIVTGAGVVITFNIHDKLHPTLDKNGDGQPDEWFSYNFNGDLKELKKDRNHDGTVDHIEEYTNGKISLARVDMNNNGVFEVTMHYDANGRMLRMERDLDEDGRPDRVIRFDPETEAQIGAETILGASKP